MFAGGYLWSGCGFKCGKAGLLTAGFWWVGIAFLSKEGEGGFDFVVRAFGFGDAFVQTEFVGYEGLLEGWVVCFVGKTKGFFAAGQGDVRGVRASFAGEPAGFHGLKDLLGQVEEAGRWFDLRVKYACFGERADAVELEVESRGVDGSEGVLDLIEA